MKSNIIVMVGSNHFKRDEFLQKSRKVIEFSYIKLEVLLKSISETMKRKLTEEECIQFFHKYVTKLSKNDEISIIDIDNYKDEIIEKLLSGSELCFVDLEKSKLNENVVYINGKEKSLEEVLRSISGEV